MPNHRNVYVSPATSMSKTSKFQLTPLVETIQNCCADVKQFHKKWILWIQSGLLLDMDDLEDMGKSLNFEKLLENLEKSWSFKKVAKYWSRLYFKLLIIILEYSDVIKNQKEEEKEKGKEN